MAIQLDLTSSQYGVPFAGAYFRIVTASVGRRRGSDVKFGVMLDVAGYGTATPSENTREVDFRRYHCSLDEVETQVGATFLERCYAWLMAQPDMSGSVAA